MRISWVSSQRGANTAYAWRIGVVVSLPLFVLLLIWSLQAPIVVLILRRRTLARSDPVPCLNSVNIERIVVDIPRLGPPFDLSIDRWSEVRAALAPSVRIVSPAASASLGSLTIEGNPFRRIRIELFEGHATCEFSVSGGKYRAGCPADVLLNVLSSCLSAEPSQTDGETLREADQKSGE